MSGSVDIIKDEQHMKSLEKFGTPFGEIALHDDQHKLRSASVIAKTHTSLLLIPGKHYKNYLQVSHTERLRQSVELLR